jgi:Zn-finger nucleic acid-binding protein
MDDKNRTKFSELEYEKFLRVVKYMETTNYSEEKLNEGRKDFYNWFTEYDCRRKTDFKETFPELIKFMEQCSELV